MSRWKVKQIYQIETQNEMLNQETGVQVPEAVPGKPPCPVEHPHIKSYSFLERKS